MTSTRRPANPSSAGQQGDGRNHHDQHAERGAGGEAAHEGEAHEVQAHQRDDHGRAREQHRATRRVDGRCGRVDRLHARVQALAVPRDDEQRVVDPDAESDHRGELRREVRHRLHVADQHGERDTSAQPEQRGDDREAHREDGTERDQQDDDRREQAECLALGHLELGEHVAAVLDGEPLDVHVLAEVLDLGTEVDDLLVLAVAHLQFGERDRLGLAHLRRALRVVRAGDADAVELFDLGEQSLHRGLHLRVVDALLGLEDDLRVEAGPIGVRRFELALHVARLAVRQLHVGPVVRADDAVGDDVEDDEDCDPRDEDESTAAYAESGDAIEHGGKLAFGFGVRYGMRPRANAELIGDPAARCGARAGCSKYDAGYAAGVTTNGRFWPRVTNVTRCSRP